MFVNSRCRKCGSTVPFDDTRELMYCCYCGAQLFRTDIIAGTPAPVPAPAAPKQANAVSGPNLVVSYQSKYPDEPMILIIVETKESVSVYPGYQTPVCRSQCQRPNNDRLLSWRCRSYKHSISFSGSPHCHELKAFVI